MAATNAPSICSSVNPSSVPSIVTSGWSRRYSVAYSNSINAASRFVTSGRKWCTRAMRSKLAPMKKFVGTLRNHEDLLMNYFKAGKLYNSGIVEGLNLRINLCMRKAYGYRSFDLLQTFLYHTLGDLLEPKFTHRFC